MYRLYARVIEQDTLPVGPSVRTSTYYACLPACRCLHVLAQARPMMTCIALVDTYGGAGYIDARFVLRRCAVRSRHDTNFFAPVYLLISTHRNCFYGDYAVSWSFGATI